jgi:hypothetical protein
MGSGVAEKGRLYVNKGRRVFVATNAGNCPTINVTRGKFVKFRDDYSKGFKTSKTLARAIFK